MRAWPLKLIHTHIANHLAQQIDMAYEQVVVVAFEQVHRKEIGAAFKPCASVIGHAWIVRRLVGMRKWGDW
jgi:hypothetical protein